jgi:hypothetical protein
MTPEDKKKLIEGATAAVCRAQEAARKRALETGTPFLAECDGEAERYEVEEADAAVVRESPED